MSLLAGCSSSHCGVGHYSALGSSVGIMIKHDKDKGESLSFMLRQLEIEDKRVPKMTTQPMTLTFPLPCPLTH